MAATQAPHGHGVSAVLLSLIGLESEATAIRYFHMSVVPGLVQTREYTRTLLREASVGDLEPPVRDAVLEVRMRRQDEVLDREDPPEVDVIVDEAALHRLVGGAATMREQLEHLVGLAERPNIRLRVVPFEAGAHPGLNETFEIIEFGDPAVGDVLYLDGAPGEVAVREAPGELAAYQEAFRRLGDQALSRQDSVELIGRLLGALPAA